ncbi:phage terminase small subunit P27 family [Acidaminococcus intestini]|nr:phage terminase small subunit P27 family [Acidaminococcus intestini]
MVKENLGRLQPRPSLPYSPQGLFYWEVSAIGCTRKKTEADGAQGAGRQSRPSSLNKKEPMPKGRLPRCPDWLEDDAKKEWKRLGKVLAEMGMLTHLDMMAFAGYCQAYARWKGAEEFITQHGDMVRTPNGYLQQVPQVSIAQTNLKIMLKFCEQFGLTPSARSRMIGEKTGQKQKRMKWNCC